jgi:hypothetical protein
LIAHDKGRAGQAFELHFKAQCLAAFDERIGRGNRDQASPRHARNSAIESTSASGAHAASCSRGCAP